MSFDEKRIKSLRVRRWSIRAVKAVLVALVLVVASAPVIDYFADFPRERHARKYSYFERVWHGLTSATRVAYLRLSTPDADVNESSLDVVEIYIRGERLDSLNENLPASGKTFQRAKVKLRGEEADAEVRYRGDSVNHWAYPNKSWRVKLRKGKDIEGLRSINLNVPRSSTQLANFLGYQMASQVDALLAPEAEFVQFRLNRMFDGVRLLLEQPDQDFLLRRNLRPGKIFLGDITTEEIYGGAERDRLYLDPAAWEVRNFEEAFDQSEMHRLISLIKNEHNPYAFERKLKQLVAVDELLQYMALLELIGSVHVDETHNGKFYFDPTSGKLRPIVWDTVAYFWKNRFKLDLATNNLFRVVLNNPGLRERKDQYLWKWINGRFSTANLQSLVEKTVQEIAPDMRAFALKITANDKGVRHLSNNEWFAALRELDGTIQERNEFIRDALAPSEVRYRVGPEQPDGSFLLAVEVASRSGVVLDSMSAESERASEVSIQRLGLEDIGRPIRAEYQPQVLRLTAGENQIPLGDHLFSKRKASRGAAEIVPGRYVYRISGKGIRLETLSLTLRNAVTGQPASAGLSAELPLELSHQKNAVWWVPEDYTEGKTIRWESGERLVEENFIVTSGERLEVLPGASITLAPGASIIADGGVLEFKGTAERPIRIRSEAEGAPWGVVAQIGGADAYFEHVRLAGAGRAVHRGIRLEGALSIHNAGAELRSVVIENHFADFQSARVRVDASRAENFLPFAFRSKNSRVSPSEGFKHLSREPKLKASIVNLPGVGTDSRVEREFKYSITGENTDQWDLDELAEVLRKKLEANLQREDLWTAPKLTGTSYYIDDSIGDFLFRDVYFDTIDDLAYKHKISYRLRNRFSGNAPYKRFLKKPSLTEFWPYRLEFQAKTNRRELGGGYSLVDESRLEFRRESQPFSVAFPPPEQPWSLHEFVPYFREGKYAGVAAKPAQEVVKFLDEKNEGKEEYNFLPNLVVVTERFRKHLNIPSEFGSGPNPEQAYIMTLDRSEIFDAPSYLRFVRAREIGIRQSSYPPLLGSMLEMEIEFERNVSDKLDKDIAAAEGTDRGAELQKVRDAFLADQEQVRALIKEAYAELDLTLAPAQKSKYVQAVEIAEASPVRRLRVKSF